MAKKRMTLKELERIKKLNEERMQDAEFGAALIERSQNLSKFLVEIEPNYRCREDYECNYPFEAILDMLPYFQWSYPLVTQQVVTGEVDRMVPMLIGPLFTSEKHPWPCQGTKFREPIAQFDLEWVGNLANVNLGTGILQLWLGPSFDDYEIRIIPIEDYDRPLLTPIPAGVNRSHFANRPFFAGDSGSWLDKKAGGEAVAITGIGKPTLTWHSGLRDALEDLAYNMDDENTSPITEFLDDLPESSPDPTPHFFGVCRPIQYDPRDIPPCLLAMDSQGPFASGWGDSGNAQIFYIIRDDGSVGFHFQWSCS